MTNWKRFFKWIGIGALGLIGLVAIVAAYQVISFDRAVKRAYHVDPLDVVATTDSAVIERGRHLAESRGCHGCHGPGLVGSPVDSLGPIGVMNAPNLTAGRGGVGGNYTDGELARAVKHGIRADGRTLLFMPTSNFNWWPEADLVALVSYWRILPPVDNEIEPTTVGPMGKLLERFAEVQYPARLRASRFPQTSRLTRPG